MKTFPIPVVALGPGSQSEEVDLEYINMPQGMQTYSAPILPEQELTVSLKQAHAVFKQVIAELSHEIDGTPAGMIELSALDADNLKLINQVLGEGEVSALVQGQHSYSVQESVFAGIWRVIEKQDNMLISDRIEIGAIPLFLRNRVAESGLTLAKPAIRIPDTLPPMVMNAPAILTELNDHLAKWNSNKPAHVINLSLLPLSEEDVQFLGEQLGNGDTVILSRGYGNCRISSTAIPNCWQLVYFNSQDNVILHTIEIVQIPDVACAAIEDLQDSHERLIEVLEWVEGK